MPNPNKIEPGDHEVCVCGGGLHVYFLDNRNYQKYLGAGTEVLQWVKALVAKPAPLGSVFRIHMIERKN